MADRRIGKRAAVIMIALSAVLMLIATSFVLDSLLNDTELNWPLWIAVFLPAMLLLIAGTQVYARRAFERRERGTKDGTDGVLPDEGATHRGDSDDGGE
jgi:hypothetical protein